MLLAKKQSIEEQMCQSIFYNLSILKLAVKTSKEFDECLSNVSLFEISRRIFSKFINLLFRRCS
jgi:hypothetical protein